MKHPLKRMLIPSTLLTAFVLWTFAVCRVDVQPIGPGHSSVGFATLNAAFHHVTGVHMALYTLTDILSLIPLGTCAAFATLGLQQWIQRKRLLKVDRSLLILGGFYLLVMAAYALFEKLAINFRPILIDGVAEASYPSSTTVLVMCTMPTALMQLRSRISIPRIRTALTLFVSAFTAFMVIARLISGVHWLTDIIGGALLSAALIALYISLNP